MSPFGLQRKMQVCVQSMRMRSKSWQAFDISWQHAVRKGVAAADTCRLEAALLFEIAPLRQWNASTCILLQLNLTKKAQHIMALAALIQGLQYELETQRHTVSALQESA